MHGAPMPWAEVWRILHGHAAACGRRGTQPPGGVIGARTESNEDEDAPRQCEHVVDVAIINGVTGIDARRAELRTAQRGESRHQLVANLPNRMPKEMLKLHKLYLCELEESDGEYMVGLCRLDLMVGDVAHFSWFARKASAVHAWGDTPFFVPYLRPGRGRREVEKGQVPADAFLPVAVEQTVSSAQKWQTFQDGRSIAGSKVRLTKSCMQQLDTFCRVRRPDLWVGAEKSDTEADDGGGSGGSKSSENSSQGEDDSSDESDGGTSASRGGSDPLPASHAVESSDNQRGVSHGDRSGKGGEESEGATASSANRGKRHMVVEPPRRQQPARRACHRAPSSATDTDTAR